MGVKVSFDGMSDLRAALQALPTEMATEAAGIVGQYAGQAKNDIQNGYPIGRTGNLHNRVSVSVKPGNSASVTAIVASRSPHAHLFEYGSGRRVTNTGANRGRMPAAPESARMVPKVQRLRSQMVRALIAFVRDKGFVVNE